MQETFNNTVTLLLQAREGDPSAHARLFVHLQQELKRMARLERFRWHGNETMNATAILHEAYLKLTAGAPLKAEDRSHFLVIAGKAMRQVLQDFIHGERGRKVMFWLLFILWLVVSLIGAFAIIAGARPEMI